MASIVYNTIFKRNSIFVSTVFLSAFSFSIGYDLLTSAWWDAHNRGKQWKDIRQKYMTASEDEE